MNRKILISENDPDLQKMLVDSFNSKYNCFSATTVEGSISEIESNQIDLIILDRILDDGDSLEMLDYLNEVSFKTRVLILSQKGEVKERLKGLEAGADDYLPKPFSLSELRVRVERLLLKEKVDLSLPLGSKQFSLDLEKTTLTVGDQQIKLRKREAEVLACLIINQNRVVSRDAIIRYVWSGNADIPQQSTLDVYIRRLRIALGKYKNVVKTQRGFGYFFDESTASAN